MRSVSEGERDWVWQNMHVYLWERARREGKVDLVGERRDDCWSDFHQNPRRRGAEYKWGEGGKWLIRREQVSYGNKEETSM